MTKTIQVPQYDWSKLMPASEFNKPKKNVAPHTYRKNKLVNRVKRPRKIEVAEQTFTIRFPKNSTEVKEVIFGKDKKNA